MSTQTMMPTNEFLDTFESQLPAAVQHPNVMIYLAFLAVICIAIWRRAQKLAPAVGLGVQVLNTNANGSPHHATKCHCQRSFYIC